MIKDIEFEFSLKHGAGGNSLPVIDIKVDNGDTSTLTELFAINSTDFNQLYQKDEFKQIRFTMDNTYTNFTSLTSVTGGRNTQTKVISLSARPQFTYVYPEINLIPRSVVSFNTNFRIQGYNLNTVHSVYIEYI